MNMLSAALPLLVLVAAGYLSPAEAVLTVNIPWGVSPKVVYNIHVSVPVPTKPPVKVPTKAPIKTPTKPTTAPTKPSTTPTPVKKPPPPPAPVHPPPSPVITFPPPAPIVTGRRSLLATKLTYPYRYLISKSGTKYRFKTLKVSPYTKLKFKVGSYGSKGHHGLARTSTKYRCGHALETYLHPTTKVTSFTVTLPHKGTFHFFDPTLTPVTIKKNGKKVGTAKELVDCEFDFISLTVTVT